MDRPADDERDADYDDEDFVRQVEWASTHDLKDAFVKHSMLEFGLDATEWTFLSDEGDPEVDLDSFNEFFLARSCLGQVPGGAPFSQRSELATACTNRMQIKN